MNKYNAFISYSRKDYKDENNQLIPNSVITKIISAFKKNNISYWIDENGIYTGDNFAPKIAEAIKDSSVFVFVSTKNSNESQWTQNEICVAQLYKKPILPIRCDDSLYAQSVIMYLASIDYCDYKSSPESAISKLVKSVKDKISPEPMDNDNTVNFELEVLKSLNDINHQIADTSQIAITQLLDSNAKSQSCVYLLGDEIKQNFSSFDFELKNNIEKLCAVTEINTSKLCAKFDSLLNSTFEMNSLLHELLNRFSKNES